MTKKDVNQSASKKMEDIHKKTDATNRNIKNKF